MYKAKGSFYLRSKICAVAMRNEIAGTWVAFSPSRIY
jgi:hypothetical protein